ncbi:hypothetical protein [Amycolatopsis viridis]|uniref:Uncharacterized protein n=1 Tax=Amycolatopsis viridis TaxID=185678 RepID=A0ABX0SRG5_9PSEU|nr:hypothetical protein [Amycolatopsis viridis]NIH79089.1 hypothetical protein [Amycolatopsis viridis]
MGRDPLRGARFGRGGWIGVGFALYELYEKLTRRGDGFKHPWKWNLSRRMPGGGAPGPNVNEPCCGLRGNTPNRSPGRLSKNSRYLSNPGNSAVAAAAAAAAAAARKAARQHRVEQDARTWHARPVTTPTLAEGIQDLINTVLPSIDLGVLDATRVNGDDDPYQPGVAAGSGEPAALPGARGYLSDACAQRGSTSDNVIWSCVGSSATPHGFDGRDQFEAFAALLREGLGDAGFEGTFAAFQGSAVTGKSYRTGEPFDVGRTSDFDIALAGPEIFAAAQAAGIGLRGKGTRTGPLRAHDLAALGLTDLRADLSDLAGRDVNFMIYRSSEVALGRAPSIIVP